MLLIKLFCFATMHKSNAVPIFESDKEHAKDIAKRLKINFNTISIEELMKSFEDSFLKSFPSFVESLSIPENLKDKFKEISITYDKGWKDNLLEELRESFVKDQSRGFTSLGPQTSDLSVKINKQDSGNILSRGEQKLLILLIYLFFIEAYNDLRPVSYTHLTLPTKRIV